MGLGIPCNDTERGCVNLTDMPILVYIEKYSDLVNAFDMFNWILKFLFSKIRSCMYQKHNSGIVL